jgi:hypothetical protein
LACVGFVGYRGKCQVQCVVFWRTLAWAELFFKDLKKIYLYSGYHSSHGEIIYPYSWMPDPISNYFLTLKT